MFMGKFAKPLQDSTRIQIVNKVFIKITDNKYHLLKPKISSSLKYDSFKQEKTKMWSEIHSKLEKIILPPTGKKYN